jgi:vacuolar protein sorting-associated protein 45
MASSSSARGAKSSVILSVRDYIARMASEVSGMKVLVLDAATTGIVSMVYTQTQILQHEVFLVEKIERARTDKMAHLKAIYFVRPTHENVKLLQDELKDPKYGEYHLFFSNTARDTMIQQLAEADEHEVVQQVQEYFADFEAINSDLASLGVPSTAGLSDEARWDQPTFDRVQQGVCALLLALKKRPLIRYNARSEACMRVAESVLSTIDNEGAP